MRLKTAMASVYLILVVMFLVFASSMMWIALKKDYSLQIIFDAAQSLFALLLFAIVARFTTASDIKKGITRNWWLILISFCISIVGGVVGYLLYDVVSPFVMPLIGTLKEQAQHFESMSPHARPVFLFSNNARVASMTGLLFGSLPLVGVLVAFLMLFVNGALIGFIAHFPTSSASLLLAGLTPHGIFEIPALYLASAVALRINVSIFKGALMVMKNETDKAQREMEYALEAGKLFTLIIPLLCIAALVESYLTPYILTLVGF